MGSRFSVLEDQNEMEADMIDQTEGEKSRKKLVGNLRVEERFVKGGKILKQIP